MTKISGDSSYEFPNRKSEISETNNPSVERQLACWMRPNCRRDVVLRTFSYKFAGRLSNPGLPARVTQMVHRMRAWLNLGKSR